MIWLGAGKDITISESIDEILEHIDGAEGGGREESPMSVLADDAPSSG